jgi:hypothetical protein
MGNTKSTFKELTSINVKGKVEQKGKFSYLSWAYAWAMVKDKYPDSNRTVYEHEATGLNYFSDGATAYVKVGVTVNDVEHIDYLPIMDNMNRSVPQEKITSFMVNKTIQRSTVKAIAMHGLGLSLWAGEDLVDVSESAPAVTKRKKDTLKKTHEKWNSVVDYVKSMSNQPFATTIKTIEQKYVVPTALKKELATYGK